MNHANFALAFTSPLHKNHPMNPSATPCLVWFDTEYTTLELEDATLLQVAMIVTDMQGRRIAPPEEDFVMPVHLPPGTQVSDFVLTHCSTLVRQSQSAEAPDVASVDTLLAERLDRLVGPVSARIKDRPLLAGNTIHADWWMARRFLPKFLSRLHYRNVDVSSLKTLWLDRKQGPEFDKENIALVQEYLPGWSLPAQASRHDALYDVMASVAELNFYRRFLLLP